MRYRVKLKDNINPDEENRVFYACCEFRKVSGVSEIFETDDINVAYKYIEHCNGKPSHDCATTETVEIFEV